MTTGGITLAFDIYGTLADTSGVARALATHTKYPAAFAARWRDKQLEYTFRRTAMGLYADFAQCTREALLCVCEEFGIPPLTPTEEKKLMGEYSILPLFPDAKDALTRLRESDNARMFAFSNGKAAAVREWLEGRGILDYFADIVSADEIEMFKPSPQVYKHLLHRAKAKADNTYLISGNPFDIIGAQHIGIKGLWLNRTGDAVFDPWQNITPTKTIASLMELPDMFTPVAQPVKIHAFIDLENNLAKEDADCLLAWLRESGLPIIGKAITAKSEQNPYKTWDATLNEYGIEKIKTENTGLDAADAVLVGEIAVAVHTQKAGDIICIISGDHIFDKATESALKSGFRVIRFAKVEPSWTTDNPNYRFFNIADIIAEKSKFPKEWKTRPTPHRHSRESGNPIHPQGVHQP